MNVTTEQSKQIVKKYGKDNTGAMFERLIKTSLNCDEIYEAILEAELKKEE